MSSQTEFEIPAEPIRPVIKSVLALLLLHVAVRLNIAWLSLRALQLQLCGNGAILPAEIFV